MIIFTRQFCSFLNEWKYQMCIENESPTKSKAKLFVFLSSLAEKKTQQPIKTNSHGCNEIQKEIYKYFRVTMECFFVSAVVVVVVLQKPWSAQSEIVNDFFPGHWHGMEMALLENCN